MPTAPASIAEDESVDSFPAGGLIDVFSTLWIRLRGVTSLPNSSRTTTRFSPSSGMVPDFPLVDFFELPLDAETFPL